MVEYTEEYKRSMNEEYARIKMRIKQLKKELEELERMKHHLKEEMRRYKKYKKHRDKLELLKV